MPDEHDHKLAIPARTGATRLPTAHAEAAVAKFFAWRQIPGVVVAHDAAQAAARYRVPVREGQWAIILPLTRRALTLLGRLLPKAELENIYLGDREVVLVQPARSINLKGQSARLLKRALEEVRPRQANGLPYPWVVLEAPTEPLGRAPDDHDVVVEGQQSEPAPAEFTGPTELKEEAIRADFDRIRRHLSLPDLPLVIRRGSEHKHGFVTGRVHLRNGAPTRMVLTTCPNADQAEAAATLTHEFAHIVAGAGHGAGFKRALVTIAEEIWGARYFVGARRTLDDNYPTLDAWIACGIRASLTGATPPIAVHPEEAQVAVVVRRVQKLRTLALDQLGTPEGCSAAAKANDLIVTYGLGTYRVALPADLGGEMCDQWIYIGPRNPWKIRVGFVVATFCDVFALESPTYRGMHLFGRHADVVTAAWLHEVAIERIERRCEQHLERWRTESPRNRGSAITSERASFLHSAAEGLMRALEQANRDGSGDKRRPRADTAGLRAAERFARAEHEKRGMSWGGGVARGHAHNEAGFEAGNSLSLARGVEQRRPAGLLK